MKKLLRNDSKGFYNYSCLKRYSRSNFMKLRNAISKHYKLANQLHTIFRKQQLLKINISVFFEKIKIISIL